MTLPFPPSTNPMPRLAQLHTMTAPPREAPGAKKKGVRARTKPLLLCALLSGLLTACAHVPVTSLPALAAINFATTDLSTLRAAVEMPSTLMPAAEGVRLNLSLVVEGNLIEERSYVLEREEAADAAVPHPVPVEGRQVFVYRLSDTDKQGLDAIRADVLNRKAAGQGGSLTIGVAVEDMCRLGNEGDSADAPGAMPVDVFLRTAETDRFVRTLDGFDLAELQAGDDPIIGTLPSCPNSELG